MELHIILMEIQFLNCNVVTDLKHTKHFTPLIGMKTLLVSVIYNFFILTGVDVCRTPIVKNPCVYNDAKELRHTRIYSYLLCMFSILVCFTIIHKYWLRYLLIFLCSVLLYKKEISLIVACSFYIYYSPLSLMNNYLVCSWVCMVVFFILSYLFMELYCLMHKLMSERNPLKITICHKQVEIITLLDAIGIALLFCFILSVIFIVISFT